MLWLKRGILGVTPEAAALRDWRTGRAQRLHAAGPSGCAPDGLPFNLATMSR
jgi:hypothetical protein